MTRNGELTEGSQKCPQVPCLNSTRLTPNELIKHCLLTELDCQSGDTGDRLHIGDIFEDGDRKRKHQNE